MDGIYVLCVVLTLKSESVCFRVPKEKTCEAIVQEWIDSAERWSEHSSGADKRHLCGCLTFDQFKSLKKPLFTPGDAARKIISVENVK